ncbi:hypothetical protein Tco_1534900 [Tanacetum coccineum]
MVVQAQEEMGEGSANPTDPHHTPIIIQPSTSQPKKKQRSRRSKRKDTEVPQPSGPTTNVADEAVNEEIDDGLERAATTATGLEAEQDIGNIDKTQSKATLNKPSSSRTSSGSGPRRQETMGDTIAHTRLKLEELMELCITLQSRVLALETTKTTQATEIATRVESSDDELSLGEDVSKQGRRTYNIDADEDIILENVHDAEMFNVNDLHGEEMFVEKEVPVKEVSVVSKVTSKEITLGQALVEIKTSKPKAKGIVFKEPSEFTTTTTPIVSSQQPKVQEKGKGIMVE